VAKIIIGFILGFAAALAMSDAIDFVVTVGAGEYD
jgi:hypothetical protein